MVSIGHFRDQLVTAMASSPVAYVTHFDGGYVESTIAALLLPGEGESGFFDITFDDVCVFDASLGILDFPGGRRLDPGRKPDFARSLGSFIAPGENIDPELDLGDVAVMVVKNAAPLLEAPEVQSLLTLFAQHYRTGRYKAPKCLVIIDPTPVNELPASIERIITTVDLPGPSEAEIRQLIDEMALSGTTLSSHHTDVDDEDVITELVRTLQGLQLYEIEQIMRSALCRTGGRISAQTTRLALEEKKQIVKKSGIIEVIDSTQTLADVGGLRRLIADIRRKARIFRNLTLSQSDKARLPLPKGILILGMPGCGKSMIAQSIANAFGVSLLRLDVNRLMGQYVGQSERNLRRALETAEAAHPCVLWIDEIEKAFAGAESGGNNDIVLRLMGHFLTWMQERKTAVYIVATANDTMRPELMRKGRFDEVYFVNFPDQSEALAILNKKIGDFENLPIYDFSQIDDDARKRIVAEMQGNPYGGFSGAEIKSLVDSVIEEAFLDYVARLETAEPGSEPSPSQILLPTFIAKVKLMKPNVMSAQKGTKDNPTAIERILRLKDRFISASE